MGGSKVVPLATPNSTTFAVCGDRAPECLALERLLQLLWRLAHAGRPTASHRRREATQMTLLKDRGTKRPDQDRRGTDDGEDAVATAGERDIEGRDRDLAADVRDREAEARDDAAGDLDRTTGDRAASDRQEEAGERAQTPSRHAGAADNRERAINDRRVAAEDRAPVSYTHL